VQARRPASLGSRCANICGRLAACRGTSSQGWKVFTASGPASKGSVRTPVLALTSLPWHCTAGIARFVNFEVDPLVPRPLEVDGMQVVGPLTADAELCAHPEGNQLTLTIQLDSRLRREAGEVQLAQLSDEVARAQAPQRWPKIVVEHRAAVGPRSIGPTLPTAAPFKPIVNCTHATPRSRRTGELELLLTTPIGGVCLTNGEC